MEEPAPVKILRGFLPWRLRSEAAYLPLKPYLIYISPFYKSSTTANDYHDDSVREKASARPDLLGRICWVERQAQHEPCSSNVLQIAVCKSITLLINFWEKNNFRSASCLLDERRISKEFAAEKIVCTLSKLFEIESERELALSS